MGSVMREIEYIEPSYEWEIFLRDYVSKSDLSKLFNVSKAWIDKVFYDEKEKIKVYLISVRDGINGEKEEHRNRYIYYSKYYVQCILREAKWYRFTGKAEDYEAIKKSGELMWFWEGIDWVDDIILENIHPGYRMPQGGIREKTAVKSGYLKVVLRHVTFYYEPMK